MSGKKDVVVQVTESQLESIYNRLKTSEQSLKTQENHVNQAIKEVQKKSDEKLTQLKSQMNQQRTKMDQLEIDFAKRMQSQQNLFDQKMRNQTQYVDQRFEKVEAEIENLKHEVLKQAKNQKSYTDAKVLDLKQSIDHQNELEKTHAQSKHDLFSVVFQRIQSHQRSRKFIKNQIQELEQYEHDIQQAFIDGMYNSAYDRSLTAYQKALEAELELNINENIWLQYQQFALQQTKLAQAQIISLEDFEVCFPNDQGNILSEKIDINHWTYGKLDGLKLNVQQLLDLLDDGSIENLEIDELKQISEQAQTYRDTSNKLLEYAKRSLIKAQERFEIADWLQQEFPLFSIVDAGYLNDDNRETYMVLLRDAQQNEISIRVEPTQDENEIPAHSYKFDFQDINGQIKHFHQAQLDKIQSVITEFHQNTTQEVKLVCKDDDQTRRKEVISSLKTTQATIGQKTTENHLQSFDLDQQKIKKLASIKKTTKQ